MTQQDKLEAWLATQAFAWPTPLEIWEASRAVALEEAANAALAKLKGLTTEMEGDSWYGSNPGVKEDDYGDVADAIRALAKGLSE